MFLKNTKWSMLGALISLILCGIPGRDIPHISLLELFSFDKLVHATIFFVLILLTIRGFLLQTKFLKIKQSAKFYAFLFCVLYGGTLEILQANVFQGRSASLADFIANSFGCLVGVLTYDWLAKKFLIRLIR